jgi:hypothetical protein
VESATCGDLEFQLFSATVLLTFLERFFTLLAHAMPSALLHSSLWSVSHDLGKRSGVR